MNLKIILTLISALFLTACTTTSQRLEQGKISFEEKNYSSAFAELKPLAEKGIADAQYAVGYMYYYGKGTKVNRTQAKRWINRAAAQGQEQAQKAQRLMNAPEGEVVSTPVPAEKPIEPIATQKSSIEPVATSDD